MPAEVIAIVLAAALLHAGWNAMAKGRAGGDPLIAAVVIAVGAAFVSVGILAVAGWPDAASYPYVLASGLIHVAYFVLLGISYRYADYTAIYPLMRGAAPMLTAFLGFVVLDERLSLSLLGGVVLLSAGVLGLGAHAVWRGGLSGTGLAIACANIGVIVAYTLCDGLGARLSANPAGYVALMMLLSGALVAALIGCVRPREVVEGLRRHWLMGLLGGLMAMASYGAALWAMTRAPIGAVAALRETSVLFGTLIGALFMSERLTPGRVLATAAIFAGLACMRLG